MVLSFIKKKLCSFSEEQNERKNTTKSKINEQTLIISLPLRDWVTYIFLSAIALSSVPRGGGVSQERRKLDTGLVDLLRSSGEVRLPRSPF